MNVVNVMKGLDYLRLNLGLICLLERSNVVNKVEKAMVEDAICLGGYEYIYECVMICRAYIDETICLEVRCFYSKDMFKTLGTCVHINIIIYAMI